MAYARGRRGMGNERATYETARLRLARYRLEGAQARKRAADHVTQVSADALQVERAGVWLLQERAKKLVCTSLYTRSNAQHTAGAALDLSPHPAYLAALAERRVIA